MQKAGKHLEIPMLVSTIVMLSTGVIGEVANLVPPEQWLVIG